MSKKILALFLVVAMVCTLLVTPVLADEAGITAINDDSAAAFPDTQGNWAEASINRWGAANVVKGDHAGNFNPGNTITRAELAQVLVNLLGLTDQAEAGTFTDVKAGDWFEDAVLKCAAAGIMKGDGTGLANPNSFITRQEAIVMIGRALGVKPATGASLSGFQDGAAVADWAAPYLAVLTDKGILSGVADGNGALNVLPLTNIDRASTVSLLDKAIGQYVVTAGTVKADDANKFVVVKAPEGESVVITGETAGVTVAAGNAADVKMDKVTAGSVKVDAPVKVELTADAKVDDLTLNADAKVQNSGTVNTVANNAEKAVFDGKAPGKVENAEGVPALKDSNGKEVDKTGVIVVPSGGGSSSGGNGGNGGAGSAAVANVEIIFVTEKNYGDYADILGEKPEWDIRLPWLLVKYERNKAGTVEITVAKDGKAVQFGTVAEGAAEATLTDTLSLEYDKTNANAWVSVHMVSQAETDHKGQTWLDQEVAGGKYVVTVSMGSVSARATDTYSETEEPGPGGDKHTLWLVGDSTVCDFVGKGEDAKLYYPRYGYGTQIGNYLDDTYEVQNLALSGRSSKSFTSEANYTTLFGANGIKEGDALIVGFGHNDEKSDDPARFTTGTGDWQTEGSFAKSLWDNYVSKAQAKGAEVVLCTPIVRRNGSGTLSDSNKHVTADGDYPAAIRKLGADKNVAVVDLTALTAERWTALGATGTIDLHSQGLAPKDGVARSVDDTHLNIYGAKLVAYMLADGLKKGTTEVGKHVDLTAGEPTKATLVPNPNYVEPSYEAPADDAHSTIFTHDYVATDAADSSKTATFKPTVFGDAGGNPTAANFTFETDANGNMHIQTKGGKGKVSSSAESFAMYYYRIPVGKQVELSAKATLAGMKDNQAAFGLMARDTMYIDYNLKGMTTGDYVAAGATGPIGGGTNCFRRKDGNLVLGSALTTPLAQGGSYDLSIKSNGDGFTCQFANETPQSGGFDFPLTATDSEYYYVGMFAIRDTDVTFSDIVLKIDGETLVDTRGGSQEPEPAASALTADDVAAMNDAQLDGFTWENCPANVADMQEDVNFAVEGTTVKVTGTLKYVTGFTGFNASDATEQEGHYFALHLERPSGISGTSTVVLTSKGVDKAPIELTDADATLDVIFHVASAASKPTLKIDWDGEGTAYAETTYVLDFSGAELERQKVTITLIASDLPYGTSLDGVIAEAGVANGGGQYTIIMPDNGKITLNPNAVAGYELNVVMVGGTLVSTRDENSNFVVAITGDTTIDLSYVSNGGI